MRKKYLNLGIETFCLILILGGFTQLHIEENKTKAKFDTFSMDPDEILKKTKVQKLSGSVDGMDNVISDQMDAYFGISAQGLFRNISNYDKVRSAKENALGIFTPDQMAGSALEKAGTISDISSRLAENAFVSSAASLAAMNAKYMNDETKELVEELQKIDNALKKWNGLMKDLVKIKDSISSKLPKFVPK